MSTVAANPGAAVVILAAGESSRMGEPKQLLDWNGKPLLRHVAEVALAVAAAPSDVKVVLGCQHERIGAALVGLGVEVMVNPEWPEGMASSIRAAVRSLGESCPSAIFLVCDQPRITPGVLRALRETHARTGAPIVASAYGGSAGVPALFDRSLFPELIALHGPHGAREIIRRHRAAVVEVPFADGALDLDTPEDYRGARSGGE